MTTTNLQNHSLSLEFYPPKTEQGLNQLLDSAKILNQLNPTFFSVTFGAGGNEQIDAKNTVYQLMEIFDAPAAPHITCIGSTKENIKKLIQEYIDKKIDRVVALRGDLPENEKNTGEFSYANELVEFIREETNNHFKIKVAAYPEFHPQSKDHQTDLINLKRKVDAGADFIITQFFYNTDSFSHFLDDCEQLQINVPIIPGIMPIYNWKKLLSFANTCGADIPLWLRRRMESYGDDIESIHNYGCDVVTKMCEKILTADIHGLHFYTLNQADLTAKICKNLFGSER